MHIVSEWTCCRYLVRVASCGAPRCTDGMLAERPLCDFLPPLSMRSCIRGVHVRGRKSLLLWGAAGMAISLIIVGSLLLAFSSPGASPEQSQKDFQFHQAAGYCVIIFVFTFVASFAVSWGPVCRICAWL